MQWCTPQDIPRCTPLHNRIDMYWVRVNFITREQGRQILPTRVLFVYLVLVEPLWSR